MIEIIYFSGWAAILLCLIFLQRALMSMSKEIEETCAHIKEIF